MVEDATVALGENAYSMSFATGFTLASLADSVIDRLEEVRARTLRGIFLVQNAFRTYKARSHFKNLKSAAIILQALLRSKRVRMEYILLRERHQAVVTIQKEFKCRILREKYTRTVKMVILVQAVTRGWLARRHIRVTWHHMRKITLSEHMLEEKFIGDPNNSRNDAHTQEKQFDEEALQLEMTVIVQPDFQNCLLAADARLREHLDENALLRQRLQQYFSIAAHQSNSTCITTMTRFHFQGTSRHNEMAKLIKDGACCRKRALGM